MSSFDPSSPSPSKSRRRLAAWLAFGAVGLATGAVWASGFQTSSVDRGTMGESPALTKPASDVALNPLVNTVTAGPDLTINWAGRWGSTSGDSTMYSIDLTAFPATKKYNLALLLANTSVLTGWATLQLEVDLVKLASGDCTADADYAHAATDAQLLNSDAQDAGVYWSAVDGGSIYCIGVPQTTGDEMDGTFLRASTDTPPADDQLKFLATVDRTV
jgi:hypothetical protein